MSRLFVTMETMHAVGRRNLPPVPRAAAEKITPAAVSTIAAAETTSPAGKAAPVATKEAATDAPVQPEAGLEADLEAGARAGAQGDPEGDPQTDPEGDPQGDPEGDPQADARNDAQNGAEADTQNHPQADGEPAVPGALDATARLDAGQAFVARLRAAGAAFAEAAGAKSAVVREVVPPARHRRSRCRVVFRYTDESEVDLTFVGERRRPGASAKDALEEEITHWLSGGQLRDPAWLVPDPEAPDGVAVDVTAWLATG